MEFSPDEERSLTGALFSKKPRGYGAAVANTSSLNGHRAPKAFAKHHVANTDSLQSLAVKYDTQVSDIKKVNKLWNNESLAMRDTILIPVYDTEKASLNANGTAEFPSTSTAHDDVNNLEIKSHSSKVTAQQSETNGLDFLSKFDTSLSSIKKRVEKQVQNASEFLGADEDVLYNSNEFKNSRTSSLSSLSSRGKGRGKGSINSLNRSSNEDVRTTPEPVVRSKVKSKLHKHEQRQDELFQL